MEFVYTLVLIVAVLASAAAGLWLRRRIDDRHLSRESVDSIRLLMGMLLTFAAPGAGTADLERQAALRRAE